MDIVTTTSVFPKEYPAQEALQRLCRLGYTVLDMAFDYCSYAGHPFMSEERAEWARKLRREADRLGVRYTHAHAPGGLRRLTDALDGVWSCVKSSASAIW